MAYDSVTTWRLYSAEQSVGLGLPLEDVHAARALVRKIKRSRWWRENIVEAARIQLDVEGADLADGGMVSYARPNIDHLPTRWRISMHPGMLNDLVVLHELAHCIAPRWSPSPKRRRAGQLPGHARQSVHGAGFAGAMAELVSEFGDGAAHDELRVAYKHFSVPVMTLDEYNEAVRQSLIAERDLAVAQQEWAAFFESGPVPEPPLGGWTVPEWLWGETIRPGRREAGRVGMDRLAGIVSQVERCTRTDIRAVENSKYLPEEIRLRRIAMCMAVALGFDPIYMRHQMGLVRWECGVELDELRPINLGRPRQRDESAVGRTTTEVGHRW